MLPFVARAIFRIQEGLLGRSSFAILGELRQSERWPRDCMDALRLLRLKDVVGSAYEHTPYWHQVMDANGLRPGKIRSLDDLRRFPLLEKVPLREPMRHSSSAPMPAIARPVWLSASVSR